jgi:hypothetical protein
MGARRSSVMIREGTTEEKERQRREAAARQTLRPGNRADPGLASVRCLDWLGPNRKTRKGASPYGAARVEPHHRLSRFPGLPGAPLLLRRTDQTSAGEAA